jgi:hypothetical protein
MIRLFVFDFVTLFIDVNYPDLLAHGRCRSLLEHGDLASELLNYPNLDFTVGTYIEEFDSEAEPEDVIQTIENSPVLDHWNEQLIVIKDWSGAMDLLGEHMDSVEGVIGSERGFDRAFERAWFDIEADDPRDSISVNCKEASRHWNIEFEAEGIDIRHKKIFENEDEEIEKEFNSEPNTGWMSEVIYACESFNKELINAHFEKLDDKCYFIGGDDKNQGDIYHKLWLEPSSEPTIVQYTIRFDEYNSSSIKADTSGLDPEAVDSSAFVYFIFLVLNFCIRRLSRSLRSQYLTY